MIDSKYLDTIHCYTCAKEFTPDDQIYSINLGTYDSKKVEVCQTTRNIELFDTNNNVIGNLEINVCLNFHKECFLELSGPEFDIG